MCVGRRLVCVGPFFPHIEYEWGATGFRFQHNDTNATAGHNTSRHDTFGPYVLPTYFFDDVRICWTGCSFPEPLVLHAHGNYTLTLYALGEHSITHRQRVNETWDQPDVMPDRFGCNMSITHGCPPP